MEAQCKICSINLSKYVCPRCNIPYCSLPCYQSEAHLQCSESFYKDCVEEQMKNENLDPSSKQKMMEILQRVQKNELSEGESPDCPDSDDDSEPDELAARLADVNLDDADSVWERLTADERRGFEELLGSGDVAAVLPPWSPWWTRREHKKLVEDVDNFQENEKNEAFSCPQIKADIKPFSSISKVTPSPNVRWNIVNLLAAYSVMARVFNGDHQASAAEAARTMVALSANFSRDQIFDSPDSAVAAVLLAALDAVEGCDERHLKEDVCQIVEGPSEERQSDYVLAALSDLHVLFGQARKSLKDPVKKSQGEFSKRFPNAGMESSLIPTSTASSYQITKCFKKIEYYLSWTKEIF